MGYYKPCKNCAVDLTTCPRRKMVKDSIAGLSVTSIKFKCQDRVPLFKAGQRVSLMWTCWSEGDDGPDDGLPVRFKATVIAEQRLRFIVRVDDADDLEQGIPARNVFKNDNLVIKAKPADMAWIDEPDRTICQTCCAYPDEPSECHGYGKPSTWDAYWPTKCIRKAESL